MAEQLGWLEAGERDGDYVVSAGGRWDVRAIGPLVIVVDALFSIFFQTIGV